MTLYDINLSKEADGQLEEMRKKIAKEFGVTLKGNRLTLRWNVEDQLVDVHMVIESMTTRSESQELRNKSERFRELYQQYPDLASDLYYAETGEWLK